MKKTKLVLVDTNIYIDIFRTGLYEDQLAAINQRFLVRNSAIVFLELYAGCRTKIERRNIKKMERNFGVLIPTKENWIEAGNVLSQLRVSKRLESRKIERLVNNTLIAMSARSVGAFVLTNNRKDFELIREVRPFDVIYL
jgi:predicted nucleic acid-binding protein